MNDNVQFWYDPSTQTIYINTEQGLLCFGPQNTYCLENYKDVVDMEFVDGNIYIVEENSEKNLRKITTLRYYHDIEDFEDLPIYIETSFWGLGANELTSINQWDVVLYDPEHREQDVFLQVRSLTDVSTQAEKKKLHIASNEWDSWSHSVLVRFVPKLQKGKGIRLTIETDAAIQSIVPHIMDLKAPQTSNSKFSV